MVPLIRNDLLSIGQSRKRITIMIGKYKVTGFTRVVITQKENHYVSMNLSILIGDAVG